MAIIEKISVKNIRCHQDFSLKLSPTVTIITGKNGAGKTSLIEAIYIALRGKSFKGSSNDILQYQANWWRIEVIFNNKSQRIITFNQDLDSHKKIFKIDDKNFYRLPIKYKYPIVLFKPEDIHLLNSSPSRRRDFIDTFLSQLDEKYYNSLLKYNRALKQRNNLLKQQQNIDSQIFIWDVTLSEYSEYIIQQRINFIEKINQKISQVYDSITKTHDKITIKYSHQYNQNIKQQILNDLHKNNNLDKISGSTSIGPHRHDLIFHLNNFPVINKASRGEIRTIILALKFIEAEIIKENTNLMPIILLDDVFSELDNDRQNQLIKLLKNYQIIITSTVIDKKIINQYYNVSLPVN